MGRREFDDTGPAFTQIVKDCRFDADKRALKSTTSDAPLRPTPDAYSAS